MMKTYAGIRTIKRIAGLVTVWCILVCSGRIPAAAVYGAASQRPYHFADSQLYTYTEMEEDLLRLKRTYPGTFQVDTLGQTADGRELYHVMVGNLQAPEQILIMGSIHGREYMTTQVVMGQMEDLLRREKTNASYQNASVRTMLNEVAVHFVPMINPDGVALSQLGIDQIRDPELKAGIYTMFETDQGTDLNAYLRRWKSNGAGVDLNRNFDAKWELYNDRVGQPSSDHYKGTQPGSEIESAALIALTKKYPFTRTISYHTQGSVIYWYFEQTGEFRNECLRFAEMIRDETGYAIDSDYEKLDPAGYKDWAISRLQIPSVTIEVGTGGSPVDPAQFPTVWSQNQNVCVRTLYQVYKNE